jgi:hypothetical protein
MGLFANLMVISNLGVGSDAEEATVLPLALL